MSTAIHHHVPRSVSLSIHPCICPSTSSSSHPSIYLATHAFIWSSTLPAICRSSDLCVHLSIHLPVIVFENATKPSRFSHFSVDAQTTPPTTQNDVWTSKMSPRPSVFNTFWLRNVLRATTPCTFSTSQLPKVLRDRQFLTLFTSKCASRHNAVHFFDISTSKSAPRPTVFKHFLLPYVSIYASFHPSSSLSTCPFDLPLDLSINLSSRHVDSKTMLLDFCWQHQERSNSARLFSLFAVENIN